MQTIFIALRCSLVLLLLCGGLYNVVTTKLAAQLFPEQASGSLLQLNGQVVGSALMGQTFTLPQYLQGRPSAIAYDPRNTAGSNFGPTHPDLAKRVQADSLTITQRDHVNAADIPVDLLAASGSGLDPHISPEAARLQLPRIAQTRQLTLEQVNQVFMQHLESLQWGFFGQARVNVLQFNLALDALTLHGR